MYARDHGGSTGWIVKIRHWEGDQSGASALFEGSRYIHMKDVDVGEGDFPYFGVSLGSADPWNFTDPPHLHYEYRTPLSLDNSQNPFRLSALNPSDNTSPTLKYLYVDHSQKGDADVECWNFLGKDFSEYYNETEASPFIKLKLPPETPHNDLDDPHILISGNRKVRFVLEGYDEITESHTGSGCAPYSIELFLNLDKLPPIEEIEEEYVYHTEPPSGIRLIYCPIL